MSTRGYRRSGGRTNRGEGLILVVMYGVYVACQFIGLGGAMAA